MSFCAKHQRPPQLLNDTCQTVSLSFTDGPPASGALRETTSRLTTSQNCPPPKNSSETRVWPARGGSSTSRCSQTRANNSKLVTGNLSKLCPVAECGAWSGAWWSLSRPETRPEAGCEAAVVPGPRPREPRRQPAAGRDPTNQGRARQCAGLAGRPGWHRPAWGRPTQARSQLHFLI